MKNLFFKEIRLCFHPVIWVFIFAFPFMIFIPSYPIGICFIYVCSTYPILFLGANKGVQSKDLLYTCLLPIKKSHAIKARMLTVMFIQFTSMLVLFALSPLALAVRESIMAGATPDELEELMDVGFGIKGILSCASFAMIGYILYDLIFFYFFYRNGKGVLAGTLIGILVFSIILIASTVIMPLVSPTFLDFFQEKGLGIQLIIFGVTLLIYFASHFGIYKMASSELEMVDL